MIDPAADYPVLIRGLVLCEQQAKRLDLGFASRLIGCAILETALNWEGDPRMARPDRLEGLLRLKIQAALHGFAENVTALRPESR